MPNHPILTEVGIRSARPPDRGAITLWDGSLKHFGLRISQGGTKSFIILLRSGRRQAIGRYPAISLAQARSKAKLILAERTLGRHQPSSMAWEMAIAEYIADCQQKNRPTTHYEYTRILKKHFTFGAAQLASITKSDIARKLNAISQPSMRKHALVCGKIFFRWARRRGYTDTSPCDDLIHARQPSRVRVLTDEELARIWRACEQREGAKSRAYQNGELEPPSLPASFCTIVKLLILTGQRRGEIAALQSSWIKNNTIWLPASVTKNSREHSLPIGERCARLISIVIGDSQSGLLFPARGRIGASFNGWSKASAALWKITGIEGATLHDIRRTYASNMARIGIPIHIIEKLLHHQSGSFGGVVGIYQQYSFMTEMRQAVDSHEKFLHSIGVGAS